MRTSDWSSDVCSSDLGGEEEAQEPERLIPDVELREILIHADEELRAQMLGYLERWAREHNSRWLDRVIPFLLKVWPRQSAIRTQRISRRLTELALTMPELFAEIVEIILPWLKPRSEARRVGKECVSVCKYRCSPYK